MPGLFGLVSVRQGAFLSKSHAQKAITSMAKALSHRDDYILETTIADREGFAIARLSHSAFRGFPWPKEQDLQASRSNVFLCGVFTNDHVRILNEERLNALPHSAPGILKELQGNFSLVLIHRNSHSVILSVDRKGSEPIFYCEHDGILYFAPEVKALLTTFGGQIKMNPEAVPILLSCGHLLGDQTLVSSMTRLPGGQMVQICDGEIERKSYWAFRPGEGPYENTEIELREELIRLLKESARKNMQDPKKTIIFLSGGLDSRGILAGALIASGNQGQTLNTVSYGLAEDIVGSDAFIAKRIAERFQLRHTFFQRKAENYADAFEETNFLTDGLSDIAAFHPYELTILKCIKERGFDRVLRGDETFGWHGNVYSLQEAEAEVGLRSIRGISLYSKMLRPQYFREWSEAGDVAMAHLESEANGMEPTDAKDYLYFTHRLQGYLHSSASYKQVLFDHRNVLLDDSILEFLLRVPSKFRLHKVLYRNAVSAMYPSLKDIPLAVCSGLEDWDSELKKESALRRYMQKQIEDQNSGVWEYFDMNAVAGVFNSLSSFPRSSSSSSLRVRVRKKISSHIFSLFPRQAMAIRTTRFQSAMMPSQALLRFLVFKHWHDTFLSPHGNS